MIISNWGDEGVVSNLSDFQYRGGHTSIANDWFAFEYVWNRMYTNDVFVSSLNKRGQPWVSCQIIREEHMQGG